MRSDFDSLFGITLLCVITGAGCRTAAKQITVPATPTAHFEQSQAETATDTAEETQGDDSVQLVALDQTPPAPEEPNPSAPPATHPIADPLCGSEILDVESLIAAVLNSNPSMQAASAAWAATAERYPQQVALNDPVLQTMFAPGTYSSNSATQPSYYLGFAQEIPWHGKRQLKGQIAAWETQAAAWDAHEVRLRLSNAARLAYYDYYLVQRELDLNTRNLEVTQDARDSAKTKYEANQVSQQDLSLADLELASLKQERVQLQRSQKIAVARINTLLHRSPDAALPNAVSQLQAGQQAIESLLLYDLAASHRPELSALAARIQSEQAAVELACKEYYPDLEIMGRYDQFWTDKVQRGQIGMNINIPLNQGRRDAAVREAQFRLAKLHAEYAQQRDSINEQVRVASSELEANTQSVMIYETEILPAASRNLGAAQVAYIAGTVDFLSLMEARRQFIMRQVAYHRVLTEYHRSRANLELSIGMPLSEFALSPEPIATMRQTRDE